MYEDLKIIQSNGHTIYLCVNLEDNKFSAVANQSKSDEGNKRGNDEGRIHNGFIHGNQIKFTIEWFNGSIGEYNGIIGLDGRIYGIGIETKTNDIAYWASSKPISLRPNQLAKTN